MLGTQWGPVQKAFVLCFDLLNRHFLGILSRFNWTGREGCHQWKIFSGLVFWYWILYWIGEEMGWNWMKSKCACECMCIHASETTVRVCVCVCVIFDKWKRELQSPISTCTLRTSYLKMKCCEFLRVSFSGALQQKKRVWPHLPWISFLLQYISIKYKHWFQSTQSIKSVPAQVSRYTVVCNWSFRSCSPG